MATVEVVSSSRPTRHRPTPVLRSQAAGSQHSRQVHSRRCGGTSRWGPRSRRPPPPPRPPTHNSSRPRRSSVHPRIAAVKRMGAETARWRPSPTNSTAVTSTRREDRPRSRPTRASQASAPTSAARGRSYGHRPRTAIAGVSARCAAPTRCGPRRRPPSGSLQIDPAGASYGRRITSWVRRKSGSGVESAPRASARWMPGAI